MRFLLLPRLFLFVEILHFIHGIRFYEVGSNGFELKRETECALYLSYSQKSGAGRGIYAGVDFAAESMVGDFNPSIIVPRLKLVESSIIYYDYDAGDIEADLGLVLLGPGSIFNHDVKPSVNHVWIHSDYPSPKDSMPEFPSSAFFFDAFFANQPIQKGQEIYNSYGQTWFTLNSLEEIDNNNKVADLEERDELLPAVCLSDIVVGPSSLDSYLSPTLNISLGYGVFAQRAFQEGELITVAQVLFLPRGLIESLPVNESEILNYLFDVPDTELLLLPIGTAAMINHYRRLFQDNDDNLSDFSEAPNVVMEWFDWWDHFSCVSSTNSDSSVESSCCRFPMNNQPHHLEDVLSLSVEELVAQKLAVVDLGYYASRDIEKGEELFLDYGERFENYIQDMLDEHNRRIEDKSLEPIILRHGLEFPSHLISENWRANSLPAVPSSSFSMKSIFDLIGREL